MKVIKNVTTRYEVDLHKAITPLNLVKATSDLVSAGVDGERATIEMSPHSNSIFFVTVVNNTYYDESNLHTMEW